jgi:DNA topoisomerase IB
MRPGPRFVDGRDFSAKDFRTWHATVLAGTSLAERSFATSGRAAKRTIREVAKPAIEAAVLDLLRSHGDSRWAVAA